MVERHLAKVDTRVQFPSSAPFVIKVLILRAFLILLLTFLGIFWEKLSIVSAPFHQFILTFCYGVMICLQCLIDRGMAQSLRYCFYILMIHSRMRCTAVTHIMKPDISDSALFDRCPSFSVDVCSCQRYGAVFISVSIPAIKNKPVFTKVRILLLLGFKTIKQQTDFFRQKDLSVALSGFNKFYFKTVGIYFLIDLDAVLIDINAVSAVILPLQSKQFAFSGPGHNCNSKENSIIFLYYNYKKYV